VTLLAPFLSQAERGAGRPAVISAEGRCLSYGKLDHWSRVLAGAYRKAGVVEGMRVLVALGMTPALYAVLIALWRLGAVAVFPEPAAGLSGLAQALRQARPEAYIGPAWLGPLCTLLPGVPQLRRRLPVRSVAGSPAARDTIAAVPREHPALITFTSGSTGKPKGIQRSHSFLAAQLAALTPLLAGAEADIDLVSLPMFVLANLGLGIPSVIPDGRLRYPAQMDPVRLRRQMARHGVTRLVAPPSICARLATSEEKLGLRRIATGGGPLFPNLLRRLLAIAPEAEIVAVYGSTEAEPIAHVTVLSLSAADWEVMESGGGLPAGKPVPEIRLRLEQDEILVAGEHVNKTYLDPADDAQSKSLFDGEIWHRTGDAGRLDSEGRLWLLGRNAGRVGGLFPFAVETAALAWPGVEQAALLGIDGRAVLAVAGRAGCERAWRERVTAFPGVELKVLDGIPLDRRHNAKVDYAELRKHLSWR
jgi:olefin beta-lactone synthetase